LKRDEGVGVHVMVVCCALAVDAVVAHRSARGDACAASSAAAAAASTAVAALERWSCSGCAPCDGWMAWAFVWLLTEVVCERVSLLPLAAQRQFSDLLSAFRSYRRSPGDVCWLPRSCAAHRYAAIRRNFCLMAAAGTAAVVAAGQLQLAAARCPTLASHSPHNVLSCAPQRPACQRARDRDVRARGTSVRKYNSPGAMPVSVSVRTCVAAGVSSSQQTVDRYLSRSSSSDMCCCRLRLRCCCHFRVE
jgi:hypothetical protein